MNIFFLRLMSPFILMTRTDLLMQINYIRTTAKSSKKTWNLQLDHCKSVERPVNRVLPLHFRGGIATARDWTVRSSYSGKGKWFYRPLNCADPLWNLTRTSPMVKQKGCVGHRSPPSKADVKNRWSYTSNPHIHLHGVDRNSVTFSCFSAHLKLDATRLTNLHKYTALF